MTIDYIIVIVYLATVMIETTGKAGFIKNYINISHKISCADEYKKAVHSSVHGQ